MTTKYDTKHGAIVSGLYYAGRKDLYEDGNGGIKSLEEIMQSPEIQIVEGNISQFGFVHEDCTMIEFINCKGIKAKIATTKFRDGFDLWLINPENGVGVRA